MRLIDADALKNDHHMGDECDKCETKWRECQYDYIYSKMDFCTWIDDAPTIDAVEVVRCKDCKYYDINLAYETTCFCTRLELFNEHDWFCADGERRDPCSSQDS